MLQIIFCSSDSTSVELVREFIHGSPQMIKLVSQLHFFIRISSKYSWITRLNSRRNSLAKIRGEKLEGIYQGYSQENYVLLTMIKWKIYIQYMYLGSGHMRSTWSMMHRALCSLHPAVKLLHIILLPAVECISISFLDMFFICENRNILI